MHNLLSEGPDQNSIDLETIENESHDLVQPLPCITRKNRSHTEVNAVKSRRVGTLYANVLFIYIFLNFELVVNYV